MGALRLEPGDALVGNELARDLGAVLGDRFRVQSADGTSQVFLIRGILDLGTRELNRRYVYADLRAAQSILGILGRITNIDVAVNDIMRADLIGPSGSGKSTLLNILGLLERASGGDYRLTGSDVTALGDDARTRARHTTLGFIFQFHHLLPAFSSIENVMLPALIGGSLGAADKAGKTARDQAAWLLDAVGLQDAHDKKPQELSGGMQQRVAIARSLVLSPQLVLADEPTGNLDTHASDSIFALMRQFNREQGTAFLIVTHDPRLAARCDRIIELVDGRIAGDRANQAVVAG